MKKRKYLYLILNLVLIVSLLFTLTGCLDDEEDDVEINNTSDKKYTLMIYMCGSNLETEGGYASEDIDEILEAQLAKEINLLVYCGGTTDWYNDDINDNRNQIFKVENHQLILVNDNIGTKYMSNPETLAEYIKFAQKNYPADRYGLILWDHGGGAISGFGLDENNPDEEDSLTLDELKIALNVCNGKLDFLGFDACLMGTIETAYAIKDKANYLIASEEIEPGTGWDYKKLLNQLSRNTEQNPKELGKVIVDSFIKSNSGFFGADATLSVMDLSKIDNVYNKLIKFMNDIKLENFDSNNYGKVSKAIKKSKAFADGEMDTIDLVNFAQNMDVSASTELISAINDCVVYNKTTDEVENSYGMSIYIPNEELEYYDKMLDIYPNIGFDNNYISVLTEYVNLIAGGSKNTYTVNNNTYSTNTNYNQYDWYDSSFVDEYSDYYSSTYIDTDELEIVERNGQYVLELSDKDWENIIDIRSSVWYDDGEGYIDFGTDSYYEIDNKDNLIVSFDGNWIAINGNVVKYDVVENTGNYEKGKVPVLLNGDYANLVIYWDEEHPNGEVVGAEYVDEYGDTTMHSRGYIEIKPGDKIDFLVDYYDYYGNYDDLYTYGDTLRVGNSGLSVSYEWMGDGECLVYYIITDIYNNIYYTESLIVY